VHNVVTWMIGGTVTGRGSRAIKIRDRFVTHAKPVDRLTPAMIVEMAMRSTAKRARRPNMLDVPAIEIR
jgi:hypothetical protein